MMTQAVYVLYSNTPWTDTNDVGHYFIVPPTAITNTNHNSEERKWQAGKDLLDTFCNMWTTLRQIFERTINPAYQLGGTKNIDIVRQIFGNDKPPAILEHLKRLYGPLSQQELDQALLRLHDPMDLNQLGEVMLRNTEDVQMFLMANPDGDLKLSDVNIIRYAMIKLSKCGGLYTKAIERW